LSYAIEKRRPLTEFDPSPVQVQPEEGKWQIAWIHARLKTQCVHRVSPKSNLDNRELVQSPKNENVDESIQDNRRNCCTCNIETDTVSLGSSSRVIGSKLKAIECH